MSIKVTLKRQELQRLKEIFEKLKPVNKPINDETAKAVGESVVKIMKELISKGISPIRNWGKFQKYKDRKKYPGDQKPATPVNLKLTGAFLADLKHEIKKVSSGSGTKIFFDSDLSRKKESGHREGVHGQPKRPTIPVDNEGEEFNVKIVQSIKKIYNARIREILKK